MSSDSSSRFGPASAIWVTLGAFFGSQLLAGILIGLGIAASGKSTDDAAKLVTDSTAGQFLFILLVEAFTLGFLFWFMRRRKIGLAEIGLGRRPHLGDVGRAAACFAVYFIFLAILLQIVSKFIPSVNLEQEQQIGFESAVGGSLILVFISLVILPPIVEEILVRGFLYTGLRRKLNRLAAALIASVIFGIAHLQLGSGAPPLYVAAIDTFVLSLFLIALRERTGSLWAGIFVHGLKNGLAFLALFVFKVI